VDVVQTESVRRADIQGLRAVAVLLVVAYHAGLPVPGGFSGVDVFFAISGFVITATLVRELAAQGRIDLPRFYARRIRRLLPALAVMLSVVALLGTFASPLSTQRLGALTGIAASVFAANGYLYQVTAGYFAAGSELQPLLHTWTLAVEEQFYLGFPALLLLGWWLLRSRRLGAVGAVTTISALSFVLALNLSSGMTLPGIEQPEVFSFYSAPTRAWEFGLGALVALAAPWLGRLSALVAAVLGVAGLAAVGLTAFAVTETLGDPRDLVLPVVGTCAVLLAGRGPAARLLGTRPFVWVGDLSYSLYLWHWPLIVFARALWPDSHAVLAAAAFSIVPAWISYRWVENPIRVGPRFRGRAVVALAAVCVLVPVGASGALVLFHDSLLKSHALGAWQNASTPHADQTRGCEGPDLADAQRLERCTWRLKSPRGRIALVGDSQAGQFTEPVVRAARRAGYDATVLTMNSCPLVSVHVSGMSADPAACLRFNAQTLDVLLRLRPDVVVVASRTDYYVGGATAKAELWHRKLGSVIGRLNAVGSHVVVIHPIPVLAAAPYGCAVYSILVKSCIGGVARQVADDERRLAVAAESAAVAGALDASVLDFDDELCDALRCSGAKGGVWWYRDVSHLSVGGSLRLTERFSQILEADVAEVS
jgi:peptidoglycan/LPS O-acetylase OafA/YrhL